MAKGVAHYFRDGTSHKGGTHKMPDGSMHSGAKHTNKSSRPVFHFKDLSKTAKKKINGRKA
jgi:hypothetical protein